MHCHVWLKRIAPCTSHVTQKPRKCCSPAWENHISKLWLKASNVNTVLTWKYVTHEFPIERRFARRHEQMEDISDRVAVMVNSVMYGWRLNLYRWEGKKHLSLII